VMSSGEATAGPVLDCERISMVASNVPGVGRVRGYVTEAPE
jgi:hypothetical protein